MMTELQEVAVILIPAHCLINSLVERNWKKSASHYFCLHAPLLHSVKCFFIPSSYV